MKPSQKPRKSKILPKLLSFYYGHPERDMKLIVVASSHPAPLPRLIHSVISASGEKSSIISASSVASLHRALSRSWKKGSNFVVVSAPASAIDGLPIHVFVADSSLPASSPDFLVLDRDNISYPTLKDGKSNHGARSFGHHREADTRIDSFKPYKTAVEARLTVGSRIIDVAGFLTGDTAPSLLAATTTVATLLGIDKDAIIDGLASYEP